jgi:histone acetyltransferase MYST1
MDTWYFSPLPKELLNEGGMIDVLYVDEFSFNFFVRKEELRRFQSKTYNLSGKKASGSRDRRHPPGNEIYRCGNLSSE